MNSYYDGLNIKLLNSIPKNSRRVLELGCANGKLGKVYKEKNPNCYWTGVDIQAQAIAEASKNIDQVHRIDIDNFDTAKFKEEFDLIIIGDLLEHLKNPEAILDKLYNISTSNAKLICCLPNMTHLSVVQRLICGDMTYDDAGLLDKTHTRFFSTSSAIKMFLDNGWLPSITDQYDIPTQNTELLTAIIDATSKLGIPKETAYQQLSLYQMIICCEKWDMKILKEKGPMENFSVIVPVNKKWQYDLNIMKSPGLKEINAEIIPVVNSANAAEAFKVGAGQAKHPWKIFVHQDVYFPSGSGLAISRNLGNLSARGVKSKAVGFAGIGQQEDGTCRLAGMVVDRKNLFIHQESHNAISIDEFAVALHDESEVFIDSKFGWHLWATDLCLQSQLNSDNKMTEIINVPLYHNSTNDYKLPNEFYDSLSYLFSKYKNLKSVNTLCGNFSKSKLVNHMTFNV